MTMPQQTGAAGEHAIASFNVQSVRLQALQARREMLADQYQTAMTERGRIGQERLNAQARGDVAMVREYEAVVTRIGDRMQGLERSIQGVDRQIDEVMKSPVPLEGLAPAAPGEPVTVTVAPPQAYAEFPAQRAAYQRMMAAEGAVFLLLAALVWRFGVARGRRQASRVEAPRDDVKLQQAVDAIAIEVERLSEGQRFINNLMAGRRPEREALPVQPLPIAEGRDGTWITPH
jgi:hypothetical protein